jgi:hypothetical protein
MYFMHIIAKRKIYSIEVATANTVHRLLISQASLLLSYLRLLPDTVKW